MRAGSEWYQDYRQIRADINRAGLSKIREKYENRRGRGKTMFDRDVMVVKQALTCGTTSCVSKFGISKQRADKIMHTFWQYAKEIIQDGERKG